MSGLQWIRATYGVNPKRGGRVEYSGDGQARLGTIKSARDGRLRILIDGEKRPKKFHPTWALRYLS